MKGIAARRRAQRKHNATPKRKATQAALYAKCKKAALEYLGGVCVECGTDENLEFDHIDPEDKSYTITPYIARVWKAIVGELGKCQLLCHTCHRTKTNEDRSKK